MCALRDDFRAAMRGLAATISVVTTGDSKSRYGIAVTSVASVSLDPASLLICVNRGSTLHEPLRMRGEFCVNLLREGHEQVCRDFSGGVRVEKRFEGGEWRVSARGIPYLADAQSAFFCRLAREVSFGTHSIFIGQVSDVKTGCEASPLLYVDGAVASLGRAQSNCGGRSR